MKTDEFGSKARLIALIRNIASEHESGIVSILTETKRSVLLKFSAGKLIHSYSRTRDIGEVIQLLNEGHFVKFNFAAIPRESGSELMPIEAFIQFIQTGDESDNILQGSDPSSATPTSNREADYTVNLVQELLINIASEYVGMVADIIVEEAFESRPDPFGAIEYIAEMIPDAVQAESFRAAALKGMQTISYKDQKG